MYRVKKLREVASTDISELGKKLRNDRELLRAAESEEGRRLMESIDSAALEKAAKSGDTQAMKAFLAQILASPDGKLLAQRVRDAVEGNKEK